MIIFNGKELASPFVKEGHVIEINTKMPLDEFILHYFLDDFNSNDIIINSYNIKNHEYQHINDLDDYKINTNAYSAIWSPEMAETYAEQISVYSRPYYAQEFEKYTFNQSTLVEFELNRNLSKNTILDELLISSGILPTLYKDLLSSLKELDSSSENYQTQFYQILKDYRTLSNAGSDLIRTNEAINISNPIPDKNACAFYSELTPYEKRLINKNLIHPRKIVDALRIIRSIGIIKDGDKIKPGLYNKMPLNIELYNYILDNELLCKDLPQILEKESWINKNKSKYEIACTAAKAEPSFKGFLPKVYPQYIEGLYYLSGYQELDDSRAQIMASKFNRANVSKVAYTMSPAMIGLTAYIDFTKLEQRTIDALTTIMTLDKAKILIDKGFPEWLEAHKNEALNDILLIIDLAEQFDFYDPQLSAKQIYNKVINRQGYEDSLKMERKYGYKFEDNEIAIKGRHNKAIGPNGLSMYMLPADDYRNFMLGQATHCCQRYGDAGESCVWHYTVDPFAAAVIIEKDNKILAQGYVWVDVQKDTLVFDNMEFEDDRAVQSFNDIIGTWAEICPYKNIHVGTQYNANMNGWGKQVDFLANMPSTIEDINNIPGHTACFLDLSGCHVYSDYNNRARAIKEDGVVLLKYNSLQKEIHSDEPTKWDAFTSPELAPLLNMFNISIEERSQKYNEFISNPTPELQKEFVKILPLTVAQLDDVCEEAQEYLFKYSSRLIGDRLNYCKLIKNPIPVIVETLFKQDPSYITKIENPTSQQIIAALKKNPSLITAIDSSKLNSEICLQIVSDNSELIDYLPNELLTPEIISIAIKENPKIILQKDYPEEFNKIAIINNPFIYSLLPPEKQTLGIQEALVNFHPTLVYLIFPNTTYDIAKLAVENDANAIRNLQDTFPELRSAAIEKNPLVIRMLKNPSIEEIQLAVTLNPVLATEYSNLINNEDPNIEIA